MPKSIAAPGVIWRLSGVLPGVSLGISMEAGPYAAITSSDPRYVQLTKQSLVGSRFLRKFKTPFGEVITPTVIVNRRQVEKIKAQELTDFRNMVSICCQLRGFALRYDKHASVNVPVFCDYFDIFPAWPDENGEVGTPEVLTRGIQERVGSRPLKVFVGAPPFGVFSQLTAHPDKYLFDALRLLFEDRSSSSASIRRRVFRALEVVRLATRAPISNLGSQQDHSLPFAHWVSAFEILARVMGNPQSNVNMASVLHIINDIPWTNKALRQKSVRDRRWDDKTKSRIPIRVTKADQAYRRMYRVRCDYLHGNEITHRAVEKSWRQSRGYLQGRVPALFRAYLLRILADKGYSAYYKPVQDALESMQRADDVRLFEYPLFGVHRGG